MKSGEKNERKGKRGRERMRKREKKKERKREKKKERKRGLIQIQIEFHFVIEERLNLF